MLITILGENRPLFCTLILTFLDWIQKYIVDTSGDFEEGCFLCDMRGLS